MQQEEQDKKFKLNIEAEGGDENNYEFTADTTIFWT